MSRYGFARIVWLAFVTCISPTMFAQIQPIRPVPKNITLNYGAITSWSSAPHNGIDYQSSLENPIISVGPSGVISPAGYTKPNASRFGSITPGNAGPSIWVSYTLANSEPIYVLYGHTATSWVDASTNIGTQLFNFNCSYAVPWNTGDLIDADTVIGKTAPFYNHGFAAPHLHISVFKPKKACDNGASYCQPPSNGWGYSQLNLTTGDFINPEDFFTDPIYALQANPLQLTQWTQISPSKQPSPRTAFAMAQDESRGQIVLFGGYDVDEGPLDDTWIWENGDWSQWHKSIFDECPSFDKTPPTMSYHNMAYDAIRQTVVLFGPYPSNDTWLWHGPDCGWEQDIRGNPASRARPAMTYDWANGQVVLFSGEAHPSTGFYFWPDTWTWDNSGWSEQWHYTPDLPENPTLRASSAMSWDPVSRKVVLFGGMTTCFVDSCNTGGELNDTWLWDGATWHQPSPIPSEKPGRRSGHVMGIDPVTNRVMLVGGTEVIGFNSLYEAKSDTWLWTGTNWSLAQPSNPALRLPSRGFGIAPDLWNGQMILFTSPESGVSETWVWKPEPIYPQ